MPAARHLTEQYANNRIEADHGRLKSRLRPMRALTVSSLRTIGLAHVARKAHVPPVRTELAAHYGVLIDPARARKPKDKARVMKAW